MCKKILVWINTAILTVTLYFALVNNALAVDYTVFATAENPLGIAITANTNIVVSEDPVINNLPYQYYHGVNVYLPNGSQYDSIPQGGFYDVNGRSYLATWPGSNIVLALRADGLIQKLNTGKGVVSNWLDLRKISIDTRKIYDIAKSKYWDFGGMIAPKYSSYGDISLLKRNNTLDILATGLSQSQAFPFIVRIRVNLKTNKYTAKVIAASSASTAGQTNGTRGISVNQYGLVATTLPYQFKHGSYYGIYDRLVGFSIDFPEKGKEKPSIKLGGRPFYSKGLATDAIGRFYVATGPIGVFNAGKMDSGALAILKPKLTGLLKVKTLNTVYGDSRDVVVNAKRTAVYMTVMNWNSVVRIPLPLGIPSG